MSNFWLFLAIITMILSSFLAYDQFSFWIWFPIGLAGILFLHFYQEGMNQMYAKEPNEVTEDV